MTGSLDPSNVRAYRRRAAPLLLPAYLLILAGLSAFADPEAGERTTVARLLPPVVELAWQSAYITGGVLIAAGILWPKPKPAVEVIGDWLAVYALAVNLGALIVVRGFSGSGIAPFAYVLTGTLLALRITDLHTAAKTPPAWPSRIEQRRADYGRRARTGRP